DREYIVYDNLDRVALTGPVPSPFGTGAAGWLFTKYDAFNRVAYTGWYNGHPATSSGRSALQAAHEVSPVNESKTGVNNSYDPQVLNYYTNKVVPTSNYNTL